MCFTLLIDATQQFISVINNFAIGNAKSTALQLTTKAIQSSERFLINKKASHLLFLYSSVQNGRFAGNDLVVHSSTAVMLTSFECHRAELALDHGGFLYKVTVSCKKPIYRLKR